MKNFLQKPLTRLLLLSVLLIAIGIVGAVIDMEKQTRQSSCIPFHHWMNATCEEASVCSECGITKGTARGHKFSEWNTVQPSCQNDGYDERTCQRCQKTERIDHSALGHDWTEWDVVSPATCVSEGNRMRICNRCGAVETDTIEMLSHRCSATWHDEGFDEESGCGLATISCADCGVEMGRWTYNPIYSGLTSYANENTQIAGCDVVGTIYNDEFGVYIPVLSGQNFESRVIALSNLTGGDDVLFMPSATVMVGTKRNTNFPDWYSLKGKTINVLMAGDSEPNAYEVISIHPAAPSYLGHPDEKDCSMMIVFDSPQPGMYIVVFCSQKNI